MLILILFALTGGIVTILSPCILPILPIVLSGSVSGGKRRPLGIVTGFIFSFTVFTIFISAIIRVTGLPSDALRTTAVGIISVFGLGMLIPAFQNRMDSLFSGFARLAPNQRMHDGFLAGLLVGASLGLVWTPCVGPILASVITLAATTGVGLDALLITLAYATGTAIPLLAITLGGRKMLSSHPWFVSHTRSIRQMFGLLMLITALAIFYSWDRAFQTYILEKFPDYGIGLTGLEDNALVRNRLFSLKNNGKDVSAPEETSYGPAPDLIAGGEWINSAPLDMRTLKGNVVLVDFWTYTCINCIRTLPYLKAWNAKYNDRGLVIVGVHTPEFEFEKSTANVKKAVAEFGITYPVMQDNGFVTWQAYDNHYWPAKYLIDRNGTIRYTHFGEGNYDLTELWIQKLLSEDGMPITDPITNPTYDIRAKSPETYLGYERMAGLVPQQRVIRDTATHYTALVNVPKNTFTFGGIWTIGPQHAIPHPDATLTYHFDAANVYLVMRPKTPGVTGTVKINLDGKRLDSSGGIDGTDGLLTVDRDRLYSIIQLPSPGSHIVQLEFMDDHLELYAFTFG